MKHSAISIEQNSNGKYRIVIVLQLEDFKTQLTTGYKFDTEKEAQQKIDLFLDAIVGIQ